MDRSADGRTIGVRARDRFRRRLAHGVVVATALLVTVVMVGVADSAGLTEPKSVTGFGSAEPFAADRLSGLQALAAGAVVRVTTTGCGTTAVGTGFAVDGVVVTNSHLISGDRTVVLDAPTRGNGGIAAQVVRASDVLDLAELTVDPSASWLTVADLDRAAPMVGQRVLFAGYGGGRDLRFVEASVHLVVPGEAYGVGGEVVLIDGPSGPGFSGGPVLNGDGAVIAVLKGVDQATGLTVATSTAMLDQSSLFFNSNREESLCS